MRRHRNKIRCIKDTVGNWIIEENEIKEYIKNEFKNLYTTELEGLAMVSDVSNFTCCFLKMEDRAKIDCDVSIEEIK